jgi:hypothetical protein
MFFHGRMHPPPSPVKGKETLGTPLQSESLVSQESVQNNVELAFSEQGGKTEAQTAQDAGQGAGQGKGGQCGKKQAGVFKPRSFVGQEGPRGTARFPARAIEAGQGFEKPRRRAGRRNEKGNATGPENLFPAPRKT